MIKNLKQIQTHFSANWRYDLIRKESKIAALFVNDLRQEGAFKSKVRIPIMGIAKTQDEHNPEKGIEINYANERSEEFELEKSFVVYERMHPQDMEAPGWANAKLPVITSQKTKQIDDYMISMFATTTEGVMQIPNPEQVTGANISDIFAVIDEQCYENGFDLDQAYIFVDPIVLAAIRKANLISGSKTIEGQAFKINEVLGFNVIEAKGLKKLGQQIVVATTYSLGWGYAQIDPLKILELTNEFEGQIAIKEIAYYGAKILIPKQIIQYPFPAVTRSGNNQNNSSVENAVSRNDAANLLSKKHLSKDELKNLPLYKSNKSAINEEINKIYEATDVSEIEAIVDQVKKLYV